MTDTDIITRNTVARLAILAGWRNTEVLRLDLPALTQFAALVAEECAKVCEEQDDSMSYTQQGMASGDDCARAIRAKFKA